MTAFDKQLHPDPPPAAVLILVVLALASTAACSARKSVPQAREGESDWDSTIPAEYIHARPSRRQCNNMKFQVDGHLSRGSLIRCHGAEYKQESGEFEDWVVEDAGPPRAKKFSPVHRDVDIILRLREIPDGPVRVRAYTAMPATGSLESRVLKEATLAPARIISWNPELPEGKYLISAYVHWPNICTERFIGVEVLPGNQLEGTP